MLFLVTDPIEPQEQVGRHQHIIPEVLLLTDLTVLRSLDPIPTEEVLPMELDLLLITLPIDRVFQEHLLTEDLLQILATKALGLPEIIVALVTLQDHREVTEAPEVHPGLQEVTEVPEEVHPDPLVVCVVQGVHHPDPLAVFVVRVVPQDPLEADLVEVDLAGEEDNNTN